MAQALKAMRRRLCSIVNSPSSVGRRCFRQAWLTLMATILKIEWESWKKEKSGSFVL